MSDLFTMLGVAARALDAQRYGLDVTGQNIANVNTPGYVRRSLQFSEVPPREPGTAGSGVDVVAMQAARAPLIEARMRLEQPAAAREGTVADYLGIVQATLGQPGASLDAAMARFYNAYGSLSQSPTSTAARQQVVVEAGSLASTFSDMSTQLSAVQRDADRDLRNTVDEVNSLARQISELNAGIAGSAPNTAESLRDQQSVALTALASLIDINVTQRDDGAIDVSIGNGRALVVGANTYDLSISAGGPQGFASIVSSGAAVPTDITSEVTGGRLGGLLQVRDVLVPQYLDRLDRLAYGVASDVNTLARSGFDLAGNAGTDLFVQPSAAAGAARTLAVNGAVAADSGLVVAAGVASPGNNDIARAIAALQDGPMTGGTARPVEAWGDLVYRVASDGRTATKARDDHEHIGQQLKNLREQVSGVSLDEEAGMLLRFQRAYEANARFFQVADQTLDLLMQMVRG